MFIEPGKPVTVDELLRGMIVQSGNDACIALAEAVAGSEEAFAQTDEPRGAAPGHEEHPFRELDRLPHPQHYSTAQDLALLAAAIIRDFPEYYPLYSQKQFRYNNITQIEPQPAAVDRSHGGRHEDGYTENAGYCLVTSARRGERRLISVVLGAALRVGARGREPEAAELRVPVLRRRARSTRRTSRSRRCGSGKARANQVKAGFARDLYLALPKGGGDKLKASIESLQPLLAPIRAGQKVGTLKLTLDGKPYGEFPVVALEDVPLAGIFGRGWDAIRLFFQ